MNKFNFSYVVLALLAACGGNEGYEYTADPVTGEMQEVELGELEQEYSAPVSGLYQFGAQAGAAARACDKTTTSQNCTIPKSKAFEVCVSSSFTTAEKGFIIAMAQGIDTRSFGVSVAYPDCVAVPPSVDILRIQVNYGAVSGTLSGNIQGYAGVNFGGLTPLTEGVAGTDPVGAYSRHGSCTVTLDADDIYGKTANTTEEARLWRHAAANGLLKCMGHGSRQDAAANLAYSRESIVLTSALTIYMTDGEKCRSENYNVTNNGDFSLSGSCPSE